ncbi:MAG TPA: hypothetical protein VFO19_00085 [Vicinamibacterales bacterium]|nr:hypothetical protein [Vicinamibacterales bacterium]
MLVCAPFALGFAVHARPANVAFQQTTGLVQLLRQRDVPFELIVFPDDTQESLLHSRWLYTLGRMETFIHQYLGDAVNTGGRRWERRND